MKFCCHSKCGKLTYMKTMRLLFVFIALGLLLSKTNSAILPSVPTSPIRPNASLPTTPFKTVSAKEVQQLTGRKMNLVERLRWKIVQKKIKKIQGDEKTSKDTLSTIALITGIVGFVLLFFVPVAGLLLLLTAIITGILGRKNNQNQKSRNRALIGLVLGLAAFGLILIFAIAYSSGF